MSALDIIIGVIVLLGFYGGFKKGLFVALASLIGLIAGVYGAIYFSGYAASYISEWFNWGEQITNLAAFALTFLGIIFIISLAGKFLTKIADFAMLGIINKLLGGVFSGLMYAFILSVVFMFLESSSSLSGYVISEEKKENSILYNPVSILAPSVLPQILKEVEDFKNQTTKTEEQE
jgi:membrane protein required for colicin V production